MASMATSSLISSSKVVVVVGMSTRLPCRAARHGYLFSSSVNQVKLLHSFGSINLIRLQPAKRNTNMEVKAIENLPPGTQLPATPPPASGGPSGWLNWLIWTIVPMLFPFLKGKWGPLLAIKKEVDMAIHAVESVAEMVEEVAVKVEHIADKVGDKLPEGSKLKEALDAIEHVAEEAIKGADFAEELAQKAEDAEKMLECALEEEGGEKMLETAIEEQAAEDKEKKAKAETESQKSS